MDQATCALIECARPRRSRGWCNAHYLRFRQYGDPRGGGPLRTVSWVGVACTVPGCVKPVRCKGLCQAHYSMHLTYGRVVAITAEQRFWSKVREQDGCWLWTGAVNVAGYGNFYLAGRWVVAHRFAYESMRDEIPEGLTLDHLCRITSCVNPWHLEPVSNEENVRRAFILAGTSGPTAVALLEGYIALRRQMLAEAS